MIKPKMKIIKPLLCILAFLLLCCTGNSQDFSFKHKSTIFELSAVAGSIAMDGLSTPDSYRERNPIARPFVNSSGGKALYFGGSFGAVVLANKLLGHHPKMRHVFNWSIVGVETGWAIYNIRINRAVANCHHVWYTQGILVPPCVAQ